jgi:hypothetical protein
MNRAVVKVLFAVLVITAELFIETVKKSKKARKRTTRRPRKGSWASHYRRSNDTPEQSFAMSGQYQRPGRGVGWTILPLTLYIIFNFIPGPFDNVAAAAICVCHPVTIQLPFFRTQMDQHGLKSLGIMVKALIYLSVTPVSLPMPNASVRGYDDRRNAHPAGDCLASPARTTSVRPYRVHPPSGLTRGPFVIICAVV